MLICVLVVVCSCCCYQKTIKNCYKKNQKVVNFEPFESSAAANTRAGGGNQNTDLLTYLWNPSFQQKTPTSTLYLWIVSTRPRNLLDSAWLSWLRDCRTGHIVGWTQLFQATQRFCYVIADVTHPSLVEEDSTTARRGLLSDRTLNDLCSRIALTFWSVFVSSSWHFFLHFINNSLFSNFFLKKIITKNGTFS